MPALPSAVTLNDCSPTEPVARETDGLQSKAHMKQPITDTAEYRSLTLEQNGLAVLLCSDARAEKAAAAMNVRRVSASTSYLLSDRVSVKAFGGALTTQPLGLRPSEATQGSAAKQVNGALVHRCAWARCATRRPSPAWRISRSTCSSTPLPSTRTRTHTQSSLCVTHPHTYYWVAVSFDSAGQACTPLIGILPTSNNMSWGRRRPMEAAQMLTRP